MPTGYLDSPSWEKIRIGVRLGSAFNGASYDNFEFALGFCSGSSYPYHPIAKTTHFVGVKAVGVWNAGSLAYGLTLSPGKRIDQTWTDAGGTSPLTDRAVFPNDGSYSKQGGFFVDLDFGSQYELSTWLPIHSHSGTYSHSDFVTDFDADTPSRSGYSLTTGMTIDVDEVTDGLLDRLCLFVDGMGGTVMKIDEIYTRLIL